MADKYCRYCGEAVVVARVAPPDGSDTTDLCSYARKLAEYSKALRGVEEVSKLTSPVRPAKKSFSTSLEEVKPLQEKTDNSLNMSSMPQKYSSPFVSSNEIRNMTRAIKTGVLPTAQSPRSSSSVLNSSSLKSIRSAVSASVQHSAIQKPSQLAARLRQYHSDFPENFT